MKKKIIRTLLTVTITTSAFLMGHATTTATEKTLIAVEDITDWNTDGKELSLMLSDGTEVYAYKSESVYKPERQRYIPLDNIVSVKDTETGFTIYTVYGNEFVFEK